MQFPDSQPRALLRSRPMTPSSAFPSLYKLSQTLHSSWSFTDTQTICWSFVFRSKRPEQPWCRIHVVYSGPINDRSFLIVVDAHLKWPDFFTVQGADIFSTMVVIKRLFSPHGWSETIVPNDGSRFSSETFQCFCSSCWIMHIRSTLTHLQSNGQEERFVDTFKCVLLEAKGKGITTEEMLNLCFLS